MHALDAQVIFFVDHQADLLVRIDHHAAGALRFGMFAADELPFDQKLPIDAVQIADVDVRQLAGRFANFQHAVAQDSFDIGAILLRGAADEGELGQIARQANARAHDDIGLGAAAAKPFADRVGQVVQFHGRKIRGSKFEVRVLMINPTRSPR